MPLVPLDEVELGIERAELLAHHEAGHAVVYHHHFPQKPYRSLYSTSESGGLHVDDYGPDEREAELAVCLAGPVAESILIRKQTGMVVVNGYAEGYRVNPTADLGRAFRLAHSYRYPFPFLRWMEERVTALIRARWGAVERVAGALREHGRLEYPDFQQLLDDNS